MSIPDDLQIKVLTSAGKTAANVAIEEAYDEWIEELRADEKDIEIYHALQSESAFNSTPHVTVTIFYRIL